MLQFAKILVFLLGIASFSFAGPVSVYGALKACTIDGKGRICGSGLYANTAVQVKGISLGWSNTGWESAAFFNANTVNALVDGWKSEVIRVPIGYSENNGYKTDPSNLTRVKTAIAAALEKDVYVIIDWHSHDAHNELSVATTFFEDMIQTYGANNDRIIYEIYNEPKSIKWETVKTYADNIIGKIRAKGANNLILVGTPEWSARPNQADGNYLSDPNVAYVFHFYAAYHKMDGTGGPGNPTYSAGITTVLNAGKPIFVSEYGTVMNSGNGAHDPASTNAWYKFMDDNGISSCAWQVSWKNETSALFATSFKDNLATRPISDFTNKSNMKESGQFIYDMLISHATTAPWLNSPLQPSSSSEEAPSSSSSSEDETPIVLPQIVHSNALNLANNGVNLQVVRDASLKVFDLKGNVVRSMKFKQGSYNVSFGDLPKGLYIVKAQFGSQKEILRIPIK
ncbi:MAG: cellulase family glycosylhydrolase [Fibromonadales bacterium]|nr:cellulase family glycosylhydrolase [Fibromonadales bacterium]